MLTSFEVIPDHTIAKHLGLINLFIIRETTALYEVSLLLECSSIQLLAVVSHCCHSDCLQHCHFCLFRHLVTVLTAVTIVLLSTVFVTNSTYICISIHPESLMSP